MPNFNPIRPVDPNAAATHARGHWFAAVLVGALPAVIFAAMVAVAHLY